MNYSNAKQIIQEHYSTNTFSENIEIIQINKLLDSFNYYFVVLHNNNGKPELTDLAKTHEIIELPDKTWLETCLKFSLKFENGSISTPFSSIDDLNNYIKFLDCVSNL